MHHTEDQIKALMAVSIPVYEKVHESGYDIFNEPGDTFEEFYNANLFRKYQYPHDADQIRPQQLVAFQFGYHFRTGF